MNRNALDGMSLKQLQEEAVKFRLPVSNDRKRMIDLLMSHLEQHGPMRDLLGRELQIGRRPADLSGDLSGRATRGRAEAGGPAKYDGIGDRQPGKNAETYADATTAIPAAAAEPIRTITPHFNEQKRRGRLDGGRQSPKARSNIGTPKWRTVHADFHTVAVVQEQEMVQEQEQELRVSELFVPISTIMGCVQISHLSSAGKVDRE
ncbi:hypothetical protein EAI_08586 [Harpegnathos saltator]|uniref:SAP domain-containing protein n=1 Tax=Harpegnathos saltator TaxID=610380 RepID=E2BI93_HARSA|nr:hypothetical protein EAI_08586 [Harpegnathos saltator]